jgi:uncharacterized protein YbjQ (UPF0145 family)
MDLRERRLGAEAPEIIESRELDERAKRMIITTETAPDLPIAERIDVITAECVFGLNIFRDIAAAARDFFGGRAESMQSDLRDARKFALMELRREAATLGGDAIVGIDLDYSEISGGGKSMLFLVASGTVVTLRDET